MILAFAFALRSSEAVRRTLFHTVRILSFPTVHNVVFAFSKHSLDFCVAVVPFVRDLEIRCLTFLDE